MNTLSSVISIQYEIEWDREQEYERIRICTRLDQYSIEAKRMKSFKQTIEMVAYHCLAGENVCMECGIEVIRRRRNGTKLGLREEKKIIMKLYDYYFVLFLPSWHMESIRRTTVRSISYSTSNDIQLFRIEIFECRAESAVAVVRQSIFLFLFFFSSWSWDSSNRFEGPFVFLSFDLIFVYRHRYIRYLVFSWLVNCSGCESYNVMLMTYCEHSSNWSDAECRWVMH